MYTASTPPGLKTLHKSEEKVTIIFCQLQLLLPFYSEWYKATKEQLFVVEC